MLAPEKDDSIPVIGFPEDLTGADGFLFGFLTRYGSMPAQMKPFFDSTVQLWREQKLARKTSRLFRQHRHSRRRPIDHCVNCNYSTSRYGMLFVPIGYTFGAGMFKMDSIRGGSPYGAEVYAGEEQGNGNKRKRKVLDNDSQSLCSLLLMLSRILPLS